ncbi:MAG: hypothetical protein HZA00_11915 [Nitrospinae bacterium]|nr:hypothetical protein [Nitrospinota bacterium]
MLNIDVFLQQIKASLGKHFIEYRIEFIFKTPKSLKANIYLDKNLFISVRYNIRNERVDFALIQNNQRIFGYDNLKEWHCHPYERPSEHIPCNKPSIDKIISDIKSICATRESGGHYA